MKIKSLSGRIRKLLVGGFRRFCCTCCESESVAEMLSFAFWMVSNNRLFLIHGTPQNFDVYSFLLVHYNVIRLSWFIWVDSSQQFIWFFLKFCFRKSVQSISALLLTRPVFSSDTELATRFEILRGQEENLIRRFSIDLFNQNKEAENWLS